MRNESVPIQLAVTLTELRNYEEVKVDAIPEKVGLFIKHVEYDVKSKVRRIWWRTMQSLCSSFLLEYFGFFVFRFHVQRQRGSVRRRYTDFLVLQELLVGAYPYRLIPNLPPKRIINNGKFNR